MVDNPTQIPTLLRRAFRLVALTLAALSIHALVPASADPVEDFYRGKRVNLIIGNESGGINDIVGRLVGRFIGVYLPGQPAVVVQNMPGAGGLVSANHIYNAAAKDGLTIGSPSRGTAQLAITGDTNARFDPLKFVWLGSTSSYASDAYLMIVNSTHPVKTVADLKTGATTKIGTLSAGSSNLIYARITKEVLGYDIDIVRGYSGGAAIFLAMQRQEIDGQNVGLSTLKAGQKALWESKAVRPLIQFGRRTRNAELPDVPLGRELTDDADARALIDFADLPFFMAQPFIAPPGLPVDRAKALQTAFMAAHKDPALLAEAEKLGVDVSPIDGDRIVELLTQAAATPRAVIDRYNGLTGAGGK